MGIVRTLIWWPNGIILGNLLASVIWSALFEWRLRVHHARIREVIHHATHVQGSQNQAEHGEGIREEKG
jgi:hypothetical protein